MKHWIIILSISDGRQLEYPFRFDSEWACNIQAKHLVEVNSEIIKAEVKEI